MDVVAHGLWGALGFCPQGAKKFVAGLLVGMAPDLLSFGVFHVTRPDWIISRLSGELAGPPALSILPSYVFYSYNVTHSLLVWGLAVLLVWMVIKSPPWLMGAWGLHILCDIPTHGESYFPTPFLWPLQTPFVDGISWANPAFLVVNYVCIIVAYTAMLAYLRREKRRYL